MIEFQSYDPVPVLEVMEKMVVVSHHEFGLAVRAATSGAQLLPLLHLVSSMQTSLMSWTWEQLAEATDTTRLKAMHTLSSCEFTHVHIVQL